ncbi:hypothetical protein HC928_03005 [bacterium]|nr:hypothetical protein [bacterium]
MQRLFYHAQANWWESGLILRWVIVIGAGVAFGASGVVGVIAMERFSMMTVLMLFGALLLPIALLVIGQPLRRWLLGIAIVDIALQYDMYLSWDAEAGAIGTLAGISISLTTFAIVGLYALWIMELAVTRQKTAFYPVLRYAVPLFAFIGVGALSFLAATNVRYSFFEMTLLIQMLLLFIYISGTIRTREEVIFVLVVLLLTMAMEGLYHGWQRFSPTHAGLRAFEEEGNVYDFRVNGHFASANVAGAYFSFFLVPALAFFLLNVKYYWRLVALFAFAAGALGIFLTMSRGGWLAFGASLGVFLLMMTLRGWISLSIPMMLAVVGLIITLMFPDLLLNRLFGSDGGAGSGRIPLNIIAINMAEQNPLLGVGLNNFGTVLPDYLPLDFANEWLYTVHNKYLLVLSETGPLGLAAFLWFLLATIWRGWQVWVKGERFYAILGLSMMSIVIGHMVHMNVDVFNYRPAVQALWFMAALTAALYAIAVEKKGLDDDDRQLTAA